MHLFKAFFIAVSLVATAPAVQAQAAKQIPLRDFFKNPDQAGHALSPDGQYLAWLAPWQSRRNIYVRPLAGGPATRVTAETARDIAGFGWKGSNRLIYAKDFGGDENFHIVSVDRKGEGLKDLTPGEKVKANVVDPLIDDDDHIIVSHNRRDAKVFDVFRINVNTGEEKLIAQNPGNITGWATDHDGKLRVADHDRWREYIAAVSRQGRRELQADSYDQFQGRVSRRFSSHSTTASFTWRQTEAATNRQSTYLTPPAPRRASYWLNTQTSTSPASSYSRKRKVLTNATWVTWKTERKFLDKESEKYVEGRRGQAPRIRACVHVRRTAPKINSSSPRSATRRVASVTFTTKRRRSLTCSPTFHPGCRRANSRT